MKLSKNQIKALKVLSKYPDAMIMWNGVLTGGHGVKLNIVMKAIEKAKK